MSVAAIRSKPYKIPAFPVAAWRKKYGREKYFFYIFFTKFCVILRNSSYKQSDTVMHENKKNAAA